MSSILDIDSNLQTDSSNTRRSEIIGERAKRTGLVCIWCAFIAVVFAFLSSMSSFLSFSVLTLYFVFLILSAAFGLFGYFEIKAAGNGWMSSIFQLLTVVFLFVLFLFIPGRSGNGQFGVFYGIFSTLIPIMLMVLALISKKVALWKAFIPLVVPISSLAVYLLANSADFLFVSWLLPLSWALLGAAARRRD